MIILYLLIKFNNLAWTKKVVLIDVRSSYQQDCADSVSESLSSDINGALKRS